MQRDPSIDHMPLEKYGIFGNGHMIMLEKRSDLIADLIHDWLTESIV